MIAAVLLTIVLAPGIALADADEMGTRGLPPTAVGMQPVQGAIPVATHAPGESRLFRRADGAYQAVPEVHGHTKTYTLVERRAPWTISKGLTVLANTYNGVVPGPTIVVRQGDHVVIHLINDLPVADTLHLHGMTAIPVSMDGVAGSSQAMIPPNGGRFTYAFDAQRPGTYIYHTHGPEPMLDSGLYGAIIVDPTRPLPAERNVAHDYLEVISSWHVQSLAPNVFTLNGKQYPDTAPLEVIRGQRIRIRWINISAEDWHTMHTHGHGQLIVARDAYPLSYRDEEDTVALGPGQRADVIVTANAMPGTWLVHCHVVDHSEDDQGHPDGLITTIHYAGTPNLHGAMAAAMGPKTPMDAMGHAARAKLSFLNVLLLGGVAGFTIILGLPIARARRLSMHTIGSLNAVAIGILAYLAVEIAGSAAGPVRQGLTLWHAGAPFPWALVSVFGGGLLAGLAGLGAFAAQVSKRGAQVAENPWMLTLMIAVGIGAHNFAEGLAIGASAASGATALAVGLIVGFALHNATEGFGIVAPMAGRMMPSWRQLALAAVIGGGPTLMGTMVGYAFSSPILSVLFLATAVGALIFVIGELWSVLKRTGVTVLSTGMVTLGFAVAMATELFLDLSGG
ncbi:hypothetical protein EPN42_02840 [bacterium]|nr:MAG: hypothetical protein EPN42_02840 [bacterium]